MHKVIPKTQREALVALIKGAELVRQDRDGATWHYRLGERLEFANENRADWVDSEENFSNPWEFWVFGL